jgi:hypothetical protein
MVSNWRCSSCHRAQRGAGKVLVTLLPSEHDVVVSADKLTEPSMLAHSSPDRDNGQRGRRREGDDGAHRDAHGGNELRGQDAGRSSGRQRSGGKGAAQSVRDQQKHKHDSDRSGSRGRERAWLREGVRVRVVDKAAAGGALYLKKSTVLTVTQPHECVLQLDDGAVREVHSDLGS